MTGAEPARRPAPRGLLGVGAGGLTIESIVVLLAAPAVASLQRGHVSVAGVVYLLAVAVALIVAAVLLRRPGGLVLGSAVQPLVIAGGVVTWPMYVIGVIFTGIWLYYLRLWRTTARPAGEPG